LSPDLWTLSSRLMSTAWRSPEISINFLPPNFVNQGYYQLKRC
jgi:hypothetical protein